MKNVVNLLKKSIQDTSVSFVGDRIPTDSDTIFTDFWISDPNEFLALLRRRISDPSGSVDKL